MLNFCVVTQPGNFHWAQPGGIRMYATPDLPSDLVAADGRSIPIGTDSSPSGRRWASSSVAITIPGSTSRTAEQGMVLGLGQYVLGQDQLPAHSHEYVPGPSLPAMLPAGWLLLRPRRRGHA